MTHLRDEHFDVLGESISVEIENEIVDHVVTITHDDQRKLKRGS